MHIPSTVRIGAAVAVLSLVAIPGVLPTPAHAADVAGPALCYLSDENENIIEPRQPYVPINGSGEIPVRPSAVVPGAYTLEISAPALSFDPDRPELHFVCEVFYSPLGSVRLVDDQGTVLATQRYGNDQHDPSRAAATPLPAIPEGYEIVPGQNVFGFDAAAGTVDPNNPANARAVGADTDIVIRKVSNDPAPTPSASTPTPTPSTPAPSAPATPEPSAPATPEPSAPAQQPPAAQLARTGTVADGVAGAAALLALLGAGVIALRRFRV